LLVAPEGPPRYRRCVSVSMSRSTIEIAHVVIESGKPFVDVRVSLEGLLPTTPQLFISLKRDYGVLFGLNGHARSAVQYEIGSSLTLSPMTRRTPSAGLYLPLRIVIYGKNDGGSRIEYDLPSSLFGQFGDARLVEIARGLDVALGRALSAAAG
jgi:hypothetical protein